MAWLCVDEDGQEMIFDNKPYRESNETVGGYWSRTEDEDFCNVDLPKGTIKRIIGKELTWVDEPYEIRESNKSGINWQILLLSFIWSFFVVIISGFVSTINGIFEIISTIGVIIVLAIILYFGYREVKS